MYPEPMYLAEWVKRRTSEQRDYLLLRVRNRKRMREARANGRGPGHFAFAPGRPHPAANINSIAAELGLDVSDELDGADAIFFWQADGRSAFHEPPDELIEAARGREVINIGATDISKTSVARAFERTFGHPLLLDPRTHRGPAVEKSEGNGIRSARIVECPVEPRPGFLYQHLIDNRIEGDRRTLDLRVAVYGDSTPFLIRKERSVGGRFGDLIETHLTPTVHRPEEFLTDDELKGVRGMALLVGADFCEIDCVRDRDSGQLYAVDVNTTPWWFDGFGSEAADELIRIQAKAFERAFLQPTRSEP
jgi:hypothetical protein